MKTLDIAKQTLCTAQQAHSESETKDEDILRHIFSLIKEDISMAIKYHDFETPFTCGYDLKKYADDIIPALNELGYQVELISHDQDWLIIKW